MKRWMIGSAGLGACLIALTAAAAMQPIKVPRFAAELRDPGGVVKGSATGSEKRGQMQVIVSVTGVAPGVHGIHIHEFGKCEAPGFATAGGHWNPALKQHGRDNPMGAHVGDLPNITVRANGRGAAQFTVPASVSSMLDADGASVVLHATADDYRTDPSGNSGGRIACGVIRATR